MNTMNAMNMKRISIEEVPATARRGRESFVIKLPFWEMLVNDLKRGLSPSEAIEIDLTSIVHDERKIDEAHVVAGIKHQLAKQGFDKKYSLLTRNHNKQIFIVDHETAARVA